MIYKRFGNCIVSNQALDKQVSLYNSFTKVSFEPHFVDATNIEHDTIRDYNGYNGIIQVTLKNVFTKTKNPLSGNYDYQELAILADIFQDIIDGENEVYVKPFNTATSETQTITQTDIDEKTAFLVSVESDIDVLNYVDYLIECGQEINLTFKTLQLVELPVRTVGYGNGEYGAGGYGHTE